MDTLVFLSREREQKSRSERVRMMDDKYVRNNNTKKRLQDDKDDRLYEDLLADEER